MAQTTARPVQSQQAEVLERQGLGRKAAPRGHLLIVALMVGFDIAALAGAALATGLLLDSAAFGSFETGAASETGGALASFALVSLAFLLLLRAYEVPPRRGFLGERARIAAALSLAGGFMALLIWAFAAPYAYFAQTVAVWSAGLVAVPLGRWMMWRLVDRLRAQGLACRKVLIVGSPEAASLVAQELRRVRAFCQVLGLIDVGDRSNGHDGHHSAGEVPVLGELSVLPEVAQAQGGCDVLLALPPQQFAHLREQVHALLPSGARLRLALYPLLDGMPVRGVNSFEGLPAVDLQPTALPWHYEAVKRAVDVVGAVALLVVAGLMMAVIALAIKLDSPGPVLFRQKRVGRWGKSFSMYKFRSMRQDAEAMKQELLQYNEASGNMFKLRRDPRVTRVGSVIRRLSLDELPQLLNVLEGSMSLVGPRPPLPDEVERYSVEALRRLEAIPGITGLWQVNRESDICFDEMVQWDMEYIRSWSLSLDVQILLKTLRVVVRPRGAY